MTTPPITASEVESALTAAEFVRHLERATELVRTWPEWKQRLLGGSTTTTAPASGEGPYRVMDVRTHAGNYGVAKGRMVVAEFYTALDAGIGAKLANDAFTAGAASTTRESGQGGGQRTQPCGCVTCVCEDDERCHGCGAKLCVQHAQRPPSVGSGEKKYKAVLGAYADEYWSVSGPGLNEGCDSREDAERWADILNAAISQPPPTPDLRAVVEECIEAMDVASSVGEIMFATCSLSMNAKRKLDAALTLARTALETKP